MGKVPHFLYFREQARRPVCCGHRTTRHAVVLYATAALLGTSLRRRGSTAPPPHPALEKLPICRISWHASHFSSQLVGMADPKRIPKIKQFGILGIILHLNPKKGHNGAKIQDMSQDWPSARASANIAAMLIHLWQTKGTLWCHQLHGLLENPLLDDFSSFESIHIRWVRFPSHV